MNYNLTFKPAKIDNYKSITFSDNLEDVLDLKNVVIKDDQGNDVTDDGVINESNDTNNFTWAAKMPTTYKDYTYKLVYEKPVRNYSSNYFNWINHKNKKLIQNCLLVIFAVCLFFPDSIYDIYVSCVSSFLVGSILYLFKQLHK